MGPILLSLILVNYTGRSIIDFHGVTPDLHQCKRQENQAWLFWAAGIWTNLSSGFVSVGLTAPVPSFLVTPKRTVAFCTPFAQV